MNDRDKIKLEIINDCKAMYCEYILDHIREQVAILKNNKL